MLEAQVADQSSNGDDSMSRQGKQLETEVLYTRSFFMGLLSGILFDTFSDEKPEELSLKAQKFIKTVPG